jgi:hypothetical protein
VQQSIVGLAQDTWLLPFSKMFDVIPLTDTPATAPPVSEPSVLRLYVSARGVQVWAAAAQYAHVDYTHIANVACEG